LAIYDADGNVLSSINTSLLPDHIEPDQGKHYIQVSNFLPLITITKPVIDKHTQQILGYITTLNRLMPIMATHHFSRVDPKTISTDISDACQMTSNELKQHLHYSLTSDPYAQAIQSEMTDFLFSLSNITTILHPIDLPFGSLDSESPDQDDHPTHGENRISEDPLNFSA
jgi:hypothetical protein